MCQKYMGRQLALNRRMEAHHVTNMRNEGSFGLNFFNDFQCLIQRKVRNMFCLAKRIDDEHFSPFDFR